MELKGKLLEISDIQQVTATFNKREFVVEYAENPQYPEFVLFELTQDRCALVDRLKPGDQVEVLFNIRGRAWTNPEGKKKYFNSLQAWRINLLTGTESNTPSARPANNDTFQGNNTPTSFDTTAGENDDLPF